jgi:hypothetical protein
MYEELFQEAAAVTRRLGDELQAPASEELIADLRKRVRQQLRYELPDGYLDFLRQANGMDWNGLSIYATGRTLIQGQTDRYVPGLVEANLQWREGGGYRDQVIFANDGDTNFAWSLKDSAFQVRIQPVDRVSETAASFEELLFKAFEVHRPA